MMETLDIPRKPVPRKPIPCPQTAPMLNVVFGGRGSHTLRYADTWTPDSTSKPYGAKCLELYLGIGDDLLPLGACRLHSRITRNSIEIEFEDRDDRRKATYYARWAGSRGETGPWSLPVTFTIAA